MKVIVYNIGQEDKENLALVNRKKHRITAIKDPLTDINIDFAHHKDAVIIIAWDHTVSVTLIQKLQIFGAKLIISWSTQDIIDKDWRTDKSAFKLININLVDSEAAAAMTIDMLDQWEKSDHDHF